MKVLVIGGVACGPKTASRLKRLSPDADITMIERDSIVSYGACGIPYYVEGFFKDINALVQTPVGAPRTPAFFDKVKGFKVITKTEAVEIDRQNKKVHVRSVESGDVDVLDYDKLVLATGGSPVRPPLRGIGLKNVTFMTHPDNAANLVENIEKQGLKNAVLVGAGLINMEMAEALTKRGVKVTVVEMAQQVMPGAFDSDISMLAQRYIRHGRLNFVFGEKVTAIKGETSVSGVETEKQVIPADVVVIATGTRPNDDLAKKKRSCLHGEGWYYY
jgi:NADPH-dependent 2,4-dienoyl-CoA reductase/sulfur reductase-like enzyme